MWLSLAAALVGVAFIVGYLVAEHRISPYAVLHRLEVPLVDYIRARLDGRQASLHQAWYRATGPVDVQTTLLGLASHRVPVPVGGTVAGGALTRVGSAVLLLTGGGEVFVVGPQGARGATIDLPDNGAAAYAALANDPAYRTYNFARPGFFGPRYHHLLYFEQGHRQGLLLSYTEWNDDAKCFANVLARVDLPNGADPLARTIGAGDWVRLFATHPCLPLRTQGVALPGHLAGGRMAQAGGTVLLSSGYFGSRDTGPAVELAQRRDNDYGQLLAVDIATGDHRVISTGHRNPQGLLVDADGTIWSTEHGPHGGDELNRIVTGGNYGWPMATLGVDDFAPEWPADERIGRHTGFTPPVYAWVPSVGVSSLVRLRGFHPIWDGDLLVATMAAKALYRLRLQDGHVLLAEPVRTGVKARDILQDADGALVVWSDSESAVFFYTPESLERYVRDG